MFTRSLLTVSLLAQLSGTAIAASNAEHTTPNQIQQNATAQVVVSSVEQPLQVTKIVDQTVGVEDPFDPLAVDHNSTSSTQAATEQTTSVQTEVNPTALASIEDGLAQIEQDENTTPQTDAPASTAPAKIEWTLNSLNSADWYEDIGKGQFPIYARLHVLLNNAHTSPGAIDGTSGQNTKKAIAAFQVMNKLPNTGALDKATWDVLVATEKAPAYVEYTITANDVKGPFADSIPSDYALQAKMKGLYYTSVSEMLGEKFHMDETFLKKLNPNAKFKVGEKIIVANVKNDLPDTIHYIVAHKGAKHLYLFNKSWQMVGAFPATIGSAETPSPTGKYKITGVAHNPPYSYSPSNFIQGKNLKALTLPPGPNGPVGNIWIALSKKSFGIHGTPNPSMISKSYSHGCIRLTNWDANDLGRKVKNGVEVMFIEK